MDKKLFALLLAGTLMVPHITPALGNHGTVALERARDGAPSAPPVDGLAVAPRSLPRNDAVAYIRVYHQRSQSRYALGSETGQTGTLAGGASNTADEVVVPRPPDILCYDRPMIGIWLAGRG